MINAGSACFESFNLHADVKSARSAARFRKASARVQGRCGDSLRPKTGVANAFKLAEVSPMTQFTTPDGFKLLPERLSAKDQADLLQCVLTGIRSSPLYQPSMPRTGKPLSVRMTNFGPLGWVTDKDKGYRYEAAHPVTGETWPSIPQALLDLWGAEADWPDPPEACLVNWYGPDARMGLHVDNDEKAVNAPVVSVSLGDRARFRLGGPDRKDPTASFILSSGDVVVLGGAARRCHHGVDRIYPGTSRLLPSDWSPGRINLTLRRVNP
jgi:alkylated DNA repair protein (DNA oxidative demethylase)